MECDIWRNDNYVGRGTYDAENDTLSVPYALLLLNGERYDLKQGDTQVAVVTILYLERTHLRQKIYQVGTF